MGIPFGFFFTWGFGPCSADRGINSAGSSATGRSSTGSSNSLPDSIPARVYTESSAREAVRLAREVVELVEAKIGSP